MNTGKHLAIFYICMFGFIALLVATPSLEDMQLNPFDHARITDMEYHAELEDPPFGETVLHVTERMTFDVHAASRDNLYWELWRDLSEERTDGLTAQFEVKSVTQILPDGTRINYPESPQIQRLRSGTRQMVSQPGTLRRIS